MCTSGSADVLIVATNLGSLLLYDLNGNVESNPNIVDSLNYVALCEKGVKDWETLDDNKKQEKINKCILSFSISNHCFMCDGLKNYPHYSPIKKLVFISRSASGIS